MARAVHSQRPHARGQSRAQAGPGRPVPGRNAGSGRIADSGESAADINHRRVGIDRQGKNGAVGSGERAQTDPVGVAECGP